MPAKATKKPRKTALDRAAEIGVSIPTLNSWKRCGVDIMDDAQVRRQVAKMRNIPPDLKPGWLPQVDPLTEPGDDPTQIDIEAIIGKLSSVTDKHQAQTIKLQIDGLINAYKLREAAGKYVSRTKVEEDLIRIGAAVKGSILRMEADLPPMLEGMTPAQMQKVIREKTEEILASLSDASSEIWKEQEE
jgi:hypothetical protein